MSFKVTVQPSGLAFSVVEGQTLLDAALEAKILLPYSCRSGSCSTCKAKVIEGAYQAGDAPNHILEADELAEGYTLLCQVRPESDMVIESRQAQVISDIQVRKMPSRVLSIDKRSDDVVVLKVQLPASQPFNYYAGQYLEFILKDGRRRSYSMANPPNEDNIVELHIRHLKGGAFTDHVFGAGDTQLKEREIIRVEAPWGPSSYVKKAISLLLCLQVARVLLLLKPLSNSCKLKQLNVESCCIGADVDLKISTCMSWLKNGQVVFLTLVTSLLYQRPRLKMIGKGVLASYIMRLCKIFLTFQATKCMLVAPPSWWKPHAKILYINVSYQTRLIMLMRLLLRPMPFKHR